MGYLFRPLNWPARIVLMAAGLMVLPSPTSGNLALYSTILGLLIGCAIFANELRVSRQEPSPRPAVS